MKINVIILAASLLTISNLAISEIYKCEDDIGKVSYQGQPCADHEKSEEIKVSAQYSTSKENLNVTEKNAPAGHWVNAENSTFKAYLSLAGTFSMTDNKGASAKGSWRKKNDNSYEINTKFQGMSFPISMRYDKSSDTLSLSKVGFPNSFRKYQRK